MGSTPEGSAVPSCETQFGSARPRTPAAPILQADDILCHPNPIRWLHDYIRDFADAAERVHQTSTAEQWRVARQEWRAFRERVGTPGFPGVVIADWVSHCVAYCVCRGHSSENVEA